jgi:hypothetical protein
LKPLKSENNVLYRNSASSFGWGLLNSGPGSEALDLLPTGGRYQSRREYDGVSWAQFSIAPNDDCCENISIKFIYVKPFTRKAANYNNFDQQFATHFTQRSTLRINASQMLGTQQNQNLRGKATLSNICDEAVDFYTPDNVKSKCISDTVDVFCDVSCYSGASLRSLVEQSKIKSINMPEPFRAEVALLEAQVNEAKQAAMVENQRKSAEAERKATEDRQRAERERREWEAKRAKEEAEFNALLRSPSPRTMYLSAVSMEDSGDRGKAKTVYREMMKRFPNAQETLLASQRLTRLGDVEAVESSNSNAAANARNAAESVRTQNYEQCINNRNACYSSCSNLRGSSRSSCESSCAICSR